MVRKLLKLDASQIIASVSLPAMATDADWLSALSGYAIEPIKGIFVRLIDVSDLVEDEYVVSAAKVLEACKDKKYASIKGCFSKCFSEGLKVSLGFRLDCGLSDLHNLRFILDYMTTENQASTVIRDFDNEYQTVTLDQMKTIVAEMISHHIELHHAKWDKDKAIKQASTLAELEAVCW